MLFSWSTTSEVYCSVCQTETPKKLFPPPVDQSFYTPVSVAICSINECDNDLTDHVVLCLMSETRKTASGIIYTLKSCSEATPAADCRFTLVTPPPVTVKMADKVKPKLPNHNLTAMMFLRTRWQSSHLGGHLCLAQQWLKNKQVCFLWFHLSRWSSHSQESQTSSDRVTDGWGGRGFSTQGEGSTDSFVTFSFFSSTCCHLFGGFLFRQNKSDPQPIFSHILFLYQNKHCALVGLPQSRKWCHQK